MPYTKTIRSGNLLEIYRYEKEPVQNRVKRAKRGVKRHSASYARRVDNVKRLRKTFVRLVRSNLDGVECPAFLTLTFARVVRLPFAYGELGRFIKRLRIRFGSKWRYIAVPEFQKRGAVHFHLLVWGWHEDVINHERDLRILQRIWACGTVDIFRTDGSIKLAGYLGKYMSKAVCDKRLLSQKAYVSSTNIMRPVSYSLGSVADYALDLWGVDNSCLQSEHVFDTLWLGRCTYKSFLIPESVDFF